MLRQFSLLTKPISWLLRIFLRALSLIVLILSRLILISFRRSWMLLGIMGVALRKLLSLSIWRPIAFMLRPWWLSYRRLVHPIVLILIWPYKTSIFWIWRQLARFLGWLFVNRLRMRYWEPKAARRRYLRRKLRSDLIATRAHLYLAIERPKPPLNAIVAPRAPRRYNVPRARRVTRLATTGLALALVVIASLFTAQQATDIDRVVAYGNYRLNSTKIDLGATNEEELATPTPAASPTPWPTPDPLNGGGSVAFSLRQNGNSDIYALSIGQSQPVRLTNHAADDRDPAWSPDGTKLAFASRRAGNWDIYILDMRDGRLQQLTDNPAFDAGPSWSPDGAWLVYESYRQDNLDLYIMSTDGKQGPLRLTQNPAPDFAPAWAPNGRNVAFASWRGGNKDIYLLSLDGADDEIVTNLTNTPGAHEDNPAFNADGSAVAYSENSSGFDLVYVLPLAEYAPVGQPATRGQGHHPTWSPDGKALSYVHVRDQQSHLIATSLDAWSVAPQAFTTLGQLNGPNWSALTLPLELPRRLQAVNETVDERFFVETVYPPQEEGAPFLLQEVPVNAPSPYLSDHVDQSFLALRQVVVERAGWDFLGEMDNLFEPLDLQPLPGLSGLTWNKAGRAFDYHADYALAEEPQVEIVREDRGYEIHWRTFVRATVQDGSMGEPLRELPWDFRARYGAEPRYYDQGGKWKDQIPSGYYVDFTTLAADYGWLRTPTVDNWRTYFPGILYWHYEKRQDLNWEQAMLELFTVEELQQAFSR